MTRHQSFCLTCHTPHDGTLNTDWCETHRTGCLFGCGTNVDTDTGVCAHCRDHSANRAVCDDCGGEYEQWGGVWTDMTTPTTAPTRRTMREAGFAVFAHMETLAKEADASLVPMAERQAVEVWGWLTVAAHGLADDDAITTDDEEFDVPVVSSSAWDEHDSDELAPY